MLSTSMADLSVSVPYRVSANALIRSYALSILFALRYSSIFLSIDSTEIEFHNLGTVGSHPGLETTMQDVCFPVLMMCWCL